MGGAGADWVRGDYGEDEGERGWEEGGEGYEEVVGWLEVFLGGSKLDDND